MLSLRHVISYASLFNQFVRRSVGHVIRSKLYCSATK